MRASPSWPIARKNAVSTGSRAGAADEGLDGEPFLRHRRGQHLTARLRADDVVLDADAAEAALRVHRQEVLGAREVDLPLELLPELRIAQDRRHEVHAGLDREAHA